MRYRRQGKKREKRIVEITLKLTLSLKSKAL